MATNLPEIEDEFSDRDSLEEEEIKEDLLDCNDGNKRMQCDLIEIHYGPVIKKQ